MSEEDLATLKHKRGQIKAQLTRFETFYRNLSVDLLNEIVVKELGNRLNKIQTCFEKFDEIQSSIDILSPTGNDDERLSFENSFFTITAMAEILIDNFYKGSAAGSENNGENGSVIGSERSHGGARQNIKLPTIKLPIFDGKYDRFLEYRDLFTALVDRNSDLTDIEKFYHLKMSLNEEPRKLIAKLDMTAENYAMAWALLSDRYENKTMMIHNHIKAIFEAPTLFKESHTELRHLTDNINDHLLSLKTLGENIDAWDRLIIYIIAQKMDESSRREWESYKIEGQLPIMTDMKNFLNDRCNLLEKLHCDSKQIKLKNPVLAKNDKFKKYNSSYSLQSTEPKCYFCNKNHTMYVCEDFLKFSIDDRIAEIKKRKLCMNCFSPSHDTKICRFRTCVKCKQKHNSLIHFDKSVVKQNNIKTSFVSTESVDNSNAETVSYFTNPENCFLGRPLIQQVLLSTAVVYVKVNNNIRKARILLDSGSQSNFVTQSFCDKMEVTMRPIVHSVKGIGEGLVRIKNQTNINISSIYNDFNVNINCLIINQITEKLPKVSFNKTILNIPKNMNLADPTFNEANDIDILVGSTIFWQILTTGKKILGNNLPVLQNSKLGWIIAGTLGGISDTSVTHLVTDAEFELNNLISKFWVVENVNNNKSVMSDDDKYCESFYDNNLSKDKSGRLIVRIPFKDNLKYLGNSKDIAKNRFFNLEKRLSKNPDLYAEYVRFMEDYIDLGHMSELSAEDSKRNDGYFIPHHAVIKTTSLTTRCRVVFNASCATDNGLSLNDVQYVGPALQNDIFNILARFRIYKFVIAGDISKMYRQILVHPEDRCYQKIFWRSETKNELKCYKLNTVSYGTASAPFLAVRSLIQVAKENYEEFPIVSNIIQNDFYIDDLLTGANSETELLYIQKNISEILAQSGFELRKWLCNSESILNKFAVNNNTEANFIPIGENENNKTLGIYWNATSDTLQYSVSVKKENILTKRGILSTICQIYDPLGLINPIIVVGKLFIQELWKLKQSWDDEVPENLKISWLNFQNYLNILNNFKIPRICVFSEYSFVELHGFSDASERAYGGVIYLRSFIPTRGYFVHLLCSKSRVAPLKQISIPRLELCGAVLMANLMNKIRDALQLDFSKKYYWTDSTITLAWIKAEPNNWKTFVANRVTEIQNLSNISDWCHVKGIDNPADLLSRGVHPQVLENSSLWWQGPQFLMNDLELYNIESDTNSNLEMPEQKKVSSVLVAISESNFIVLLINRISNYLRLLRITAYVLRFIHNVKVQKIDKYTGPLKVEELDSALKLLIKTVQLECFPKEYNSLVKGKYIAHSSKILNLKPFLLDEIIRVGGRLVNSNCSFDKKHQILLPNSHPLTDLIIRYHHLKLLHCGVQMLLCAIREKFWPINGRNLCKKIVRTCIKCFHVKPPSLDYLMGNLPSYRVNSSFPFLNVGLDYGGPFLIKDRRGRGYKTTKCYISLFVCMASKALHLELVTDLTTDAFMNSLKRFMSRRGKPHNIYSDNGTNYVGASNELQNLYNFLNQESDGIGAELSNERIVWHFIPAYSPSFGGIWEAGIKSTKFHIKRVIGDSLFTYEDFSTILCQVESILNSRPLCPLSADPHDMTPLTPAHLLIGRSLIAIPEGDLTYLPNNRLNQYQQIQVIVQSFWKRWTKEYLSELQTRSKWKSSTNVNLQPGVLVLLKDENLPPLRWALGRIVKTYPGSDNIIRVADVQTPKGTYRRAANKLCILPLEP